MPAALDYSSPLYSNPSRSAMLNQRAHWPLRFGLASMFSFEGTEKLPEILATFTAGGLPEDSGTWIAAAQLITAGLIIAGGWSGWRALACTFLTRAGAALGIPTVLAGMPVESWNTLASAADNPEQLATQPNFLILCLLAYFAMARGSEGRA